MATETQVKIPPFFIEEGVDVEINISHFARVIFELPVIIRFRRGILYFLIETEEGEATYLKIKKVDEKKARILAEALGFKKVENYGLEVLEFKPR